MTAGGPPDPVDPARCPLCGEANQCQLAAGRTTCWCFEHKVPAPVLARVPLAAQGLACVCRRCADGKADAQARRDRAIRWTKR
jgi:hypothetical protein